MLGVRMAIRLTGLRMRVIVSVLTVLSVLALAGCVPGPADSQTLTIGSKNDADGQLLATMYAMLLEHRGYTVTTHIPLGQTNVLDEAIKSDAIDLYPEFTGTALTLLNLPPTQDAHTAYVQVKAAYQQQFQITWLAPAYQLNDGYALCTSRDVADRYRLHSLADLAPVAGQFVVAQQEDAMDVLAPVEARYGLRFKGAVYMSEQSSFDMVRQGRAQVNVCYTTDPAIDANQVVLLSDPLGAFPVENPAPLVRSQVLQRSPTIATTLDPLAAHLSTDVMSELITRVRVDHQPVDAVAHDFLQSVGLLSSS